MLTMLALALGASVVALPKPSASSSNNQPQCWFTDTTNNNDYPNCSSRRSVDDYYTSVGYTCAGVHCAAMDPGGTPSDCATIAPAGSVVDPSTGTCVRGGPPPPFSKCSAAFKTALDATLTPGDCDITHSYCTQPCQSAITTMLEACRSSTFTQEIDGQKITIPFSQEAVDNLQQLGPHGCAYHLGYNTCDEKQCTVMNISDTLGDCAHFMGVKFDKWTGCVDNKGTQRPQTEIDGCLAKFANIGHTCAGCHDLEIPEMLITIASQSSGKECTAGIPPAKLKQQAADQINEMCCGGADGIIGNADDPCQTREVEGDDGVIRWRIPETCQSESVCETYVLGLVLKGSPGIFLHSDVGRGIFVGCGGDISKLIALGKPPACTDVSDCPDSEYCDQSGHCYSCSYINRDRCDAIDGNCCSAVFLGNCPIDPAECGDPRPAPPPAREICTDVSDCPDSEYCDRSGHCYRCSYINHAFCDAIDDNCCSAAFFDNCPTDPAECGDPRPPPPPAPLLPGACDDDHSCRSSQVCIPTPGEFYGECVATGPACDLSTCTCDGVSLAALKHKTYTLPPDAEGYSYRMSFCSEIPLASLPQGCQEYAEHPAVVKYKPDNPQDCIEIGSVGPCDEGTCGMAGKKTESGVDVTFTYTYGCENIFHMSLQHGPSSTRPGVVMSDECSYSASWVGAPIGDGSNYRCIKDKCVKTEPDLPGLDIITCKETCGPLKGCLAVLYRVCDVTRKEVGNDSCNFCTGEHHIELALAGCTKQDFHHFCDEGPKPPAPLPPPPPGPPPESPSKLWDRLPGSWESVCVDTHCSGGYPWGYCGGGVQPMPSPEPRMGFGPLNQCKADQGGDLSCPCLCAQIDMSPNGNTCNCACISNWVPELENQGRMPY